MNNQFLFQTLFSEKDGVSVASGTKLLEKQSWHLMCFVWDTSVLGLGFLKTTSKGLNFWKI